MACSACLSGLPPQDFILDSWLLFSTSLHHLRDSPCGVELPWAALGGGISNEDKHPLFCGVVGWEVCFGSSALFPGRKPVSQLPYLSGGSGASGPRLTSRPLDLFLTSLLKGVFLGEEERNSSQLSSQRGSGSSSGVPWEGGAGKQVVRREEVSPRGSATAVRVLS